MKLSILPYSPYRHDIAHMFATYWGTAGKIVIGNMIGPQDKYILVLMDAHVFWFNFSFTMIGNKVLVLQQMDTTN